MSNNIYNFLNKQLKRDENKWVSHGKKENSQTFNKYAYLQYIGIND